MKYEMELPPAAAKGKKPDVRHLYVLPATSRAAQASAAITAEAEEGE